MATSSLLLDGIWKLLLSLWPAHATNITNSTRCARPPAATLSPIPVTRLRRCHSRLLQEAQVERHPTDVRGRDPVHERRRELGRQVGTERQVLGNSAGQRDRGAHVGADRHHDAHRQPPEVGGAERVDAVADVGELREEHVERGRQRGDGDERPRPGPAPTAPGAPALRRSPRRCRPAGRAAASCSPACASRPRARAVAGRAPRSPAREVRWPGPPRRARGSTPTRVASETSSSARSIACVLGSADSVPNPRSMITGLAPDTRMFAARSDRCANRAAWSPRT